MRDLVCWIMIALLPISLSAADHAGAVLHSRGAASVNGSAITDSYAIVPGDLVQTKTDSAADIAVSGSSVLIGSDSAVKFESNGIALDHGVVSVSTTKGLSARSGRVVVAPSLSDSRFQVNTTSMGLHVVAQQGDLTITNGSELGTLPQGQETTIPENHSQKKKKTKLDGALPGAGGPWLNSHIAILAGTAAAAGVLTWVLIRGDDPAGPRK